RAPLDFGPGRLEEAARKLEQLYESLARADEGAGRTPAPVAPAGALTGTLSPFLSEFVAAMDDDLNAARALGLVHDRVRELNRALDAGDGTTAAALRSDLARVAAVLGILGGEPARFLTAPRATRRSHRPRKKRPRVWTARRTTRRTRRRAGRPPPRTRAPSRPTPRSGGVPSSAISAPPSGGCTRSTRVWRPSPGRGASTRRAAPPRAAWPRRPPRPRESTCAPRRSAASPPSASSWRSMRI